MAEVRIPTLHHISALSNNSSVGYGARLRLPLSRFSKSSWSRKWRGFESHSHQHSSGFSQIPQDLFFAELVVGLRCWVVNHVLARNTPIRNATTRPQCFCFSLLTCFYPHNLQYHASAVQLTVHADPALRRRDQEYRRQGLQWRDLGPWRLFRII
jgi:hypothetical protein